MSSIGECFLCCKMSVMKILSCGHNLHLACAGMMTKPNCPLCRCDISSDLTPEILDRISSREKSWREEREEEERREIVEESNTDRSSPIRREILLAMSKMREFGIPLRYIPRETIVRYTRGTTVPTLFPLVLQSSLGEIIKDILNTGDFDPFEEDDEEEGEYPFKEEDEFLRHLPHIIDVDCEQN